MPKPKATIRPTAITALVRLELKKFLKSKFGGSLKGKDTIRIDAEKLRVESDHALFPQVDGERATETPVRSLEFSILPQKLKLRVAS